MLRKQPEPTSSTTSSRRLGLLLFSHCGLSLSVSLTLSQCQCQCQLFLLTDSDCSNLDQTKGIPQLSSCDFNLNATAVLTLVYHTDTSDSDT